MCSKQGREKKETSEVLQFRKHNQNKATPFLETLDTRAALLYNLLFDSVLKLSKITKSNTEIKEQIYGTEVDFMTTPGKKN